jgi:hypothetical protein
VAIIRSKERKITDDHDASQTSLRPTLKPRNVVQLFMPPHAHSLLPEKLLVLAHLSDFRL